MNTVIKTTDFTLLPWPRYKSQWEYSGEEFFEKYIKPEVKNIQDDTQITINLDWVKYWYPSSFISEAFGRLYTWLENNGDLERWKNIKIISNDDPSLIDFISSNAPKYGQTT